MTPVQHCVHMGTIFVHLSLYRTSVFPVGIHGHILEGSIIYQGAYLLSSFAVSQFVLHLESSWCKRFPFSWFSSKKKPTEADLLCRWWCIWVKQRPNEITLPWTRTKASVVPKGNCWWEAEAHRAPKPWPLWVNAIFCIRNGAFCFSKAAPSVTLI